MECFLTVFSFSPSAGQHAAEKYELFNCIVIVQNASSSQLFENMLSRHVVTFGSEFLPNSQFAA